MIRLITSNRRFCGIDKFVISQHVREKKHDTDNNNKFDFGFN